MFEAERVYLRPLEKKDLYLRPKWFNDEEINKTLLIDIPISLAGTEDWFSRSVKDNSKLNLSICDKKTDKVIGMTGLLNISYKHRKAQFYITIGEKEYWGKGLPDEIIPLVLNFGFSELGLNKIYLYTINNNNRARKVYERNGFKQEAVLKEDFFCRGQLQDITVHSIFRKRWQ
jgi:RimJ/RimL family protein N-acetyltransferase